MGNLLKSVELFKSYGLFGEPKVVDFLFFWKNVKKKMTFLDQNILFSLPNRLSCCILLMLQKEVLYTPVGVI